VWAFGAEDRVVAVARVEPGVVGEVVEDPVLDVGDEGAEVLRRRGPADPAREERITLAVNTFYLLCLCDPVPGEHKVALGGTLG
jgi:hypothetical protein